MFSSKISQPNYRQYHKYKNATDFLGLVLCAAVVKILIDWSAFSGLTKAIGITAFFFFDLGAMRFFDWVWRNRYIQKMKISENYKAIVSWNSDKTQKRKITTFLCIVVLFILDGYLIFYG